MTTPADAPTLRPGGLVTVAFLKASLDEGRDHLEIFMPLVWDVLNRLPALTFTSRDVQEAVARDHGVAMPEQVVSTLLRRGTRKKYLIREAGCYRRIRELPSSDVPSKKSKIEEAQRELAVAFQEYAQKHALVLESTDAALETLFRFLEVEQVGLLLQDDTPKPGKTSPSHRERAISAGFIKRAVEHSSSMKEVVLGMLEGLVLYHAAFLPDLADASRRFNNLRVVFDSTLVRQALGYEGTALSALMRETLRVLKASGVQCLVFDKTLHEIKRILGMYELRLSTSEGRAALGSKGRSMARHFLISRYTPSDVREMGALLEHEVVDLGFKIVAAPERIAEFTAGESSLAKRLADPTTKDELEPRVVHDVDCVAGVLTLRKGHRSLALEDAQVIFATNSPLVIRNVKLWWNLDEHENCLEPVVHIRALTNLAWLKKPSLCADFKVRELVALCSAALRPDPKTWERFLRHLRTLEKSNKITSDETAAILVSAMSDQLLTEAELNQDSDDIDAATLDDIVDRVTTAYAEQALKRVDTVRGDYEKRMKALEAAAEATTKRADESVRNVAEELRRRDLVIDSRATNWARGLTIIVRISASVILTSGFIILIAEQTIRRSWVGILLVIPIVVFIGLEFFGVLKHVSDGCNGLEAYLTKCFRSWLKGEASKKSQDNFLRFT